MRLLVDSDGGVDDAAALLWLATQDVELAAVTAVGGNVPVRQAARNLRVALEAAGRGDVPVHVGRDPSGPAPDMARPVAIHGRDGLGDAGHEDPLIGAVDGAHEALLRELRAGTTVLALGPLSNLAAAVAAQEPAASRLVLMGGSIRAGGNAGPLMEANIGHDPGAAAAVLGATWAAPPLLVTLDATHVATLGPPEMALLGRTVSPAAAFLAGPMELYAAGGSTFCAPGETPCHDLLAAMAVLHPSLLRAHVVPLAVDTGGSAAWGATVADLRVLAWESRGLVADGGPVSGNLPSGWAVCEVAVGADAQGFRRLVRALLDPEHAAS